MSILGTAESLRMMNRPDPTRPDPTEPDPTVTLFDDLLLKNYKIYGRQILT